jgi:hypothetical protein
MCTFLSVHTNVHLHQKKDETRWPVQLVLLEPKWCIWIRSRSNTDSTKFVLPINQHDIIKMKYLSSVSLQRNRRVHSPQDVLGDERKAIKKANTSKSMQPAILSSVQVWWPNPGLLVHQRVSPKSLTKHNKELVSDTTREQGWPRFVNTIQLGSMFSSGLSGQTESLVLITLDSKPSTKHYQHQALHHRTMSNIPWKVSDGVVGANTSSRHALVACSWT